MAESNNIPWYERWAISALKLLGNDDTRPPLPTADSPADYKPALRQLDTSKPLGIYIFSVDHQNPGISDAVVNISRNNFIAEMREHYGENFIVVDIPAGRSPQQRQASQTHLDNFAAQFNEIFRYSRPITHFIINHHQNQYDDRALAKTLSTISGSDKRALILSCGADSSAYKNLPDFNMIVIPRPDGQLLGPELDPRGSPAYRYTIEWIRNAPNATAMREHFANWWDFDHIGSQTRDYLYEKLFGITGDYLPPIILDSTKLQQQSTGLLSPDPTPASPLDKGKPALIP